MTFVIGVLIAAMVSSACINSMGLKIDSNKTFGLTHFLMMGMNYNEDGESGVYNLEDVEFSQSYATSMEREQANLALTTKRIKKLGVSGMMHLMHSKILTNYNDGTFCWGGEGNFFVDILSNKQGRFAQLLRNIYYCREWDGKYYIIFYNFELMIWLTVLLLSLIGTMKNSCDVSIIIARVSIIGITIFELLFEARARYLYTYVPIYILLATIGIQKIIERKEKNESETNIIYSDSVL